VQGEPGSVVLGSEETPSEPPRSASRARACTPEIGGLVSSNIAPLTITCPPGYLDRQSAALPVAGRFTTADAFTAAFCKPAPRVASGFGFAFASTEDASDTDALIDFRKNDVVVYAYDAAAGEPALYRRAADLWLQVPTDTCRGNAPALASIAFVIPKHKEVAEQTCARPCG
jgi:hypothetical protein